nr:MAG TPA: hypothetical protein [Caudoviricetes sp.]
MVIIAGKLQVLVFQSIFTLQIMKKNYLKMI